MKKGKTIFQAKKELRDYFAKISKKGWILTKRSGDECLGNTFEDLIDKQEDNKSIADYYGIELKSKGIKVDNHYNKKQKECATATTLFTKVPDYPKNVNSYLRDKYGIKDTGIKKNKLNVSVYSNVLCPDKKNSKYNYKFKIKTNNKKKIVELQQKEG